MIEIGQRVRPTRYYYLSRDYYYNDLPNRVGTVVGFPQEGYNARVVWNDGTVSTGILLASLEPA
jgi:hypothetical protein